MLAIIAGSGVSELLEDQFPVKVHTPYGPHSDIVHGKISYEDVFVMYRHNKNHSLPPHKINFRANLFALKELGVDQVISCCTVGSLKEDFRPGMIVMPDQFINHTGDAVTFYDGPEVYHVSMAEPFCPRMRDALIKSCTQLRVPFKQSATYLRIAGPQFSTKAASRFYRTFADIIGMTGVPEAILARELGVCFSIIATITDYDTFAEKSVSMDGVKQTMKQNIDNLKKVLQTAVPMLSQRNCNCKNALEGAKA
ncbi:MAG: MTAP family purine nucleoside phosphorylase [Candidatus Aenigmatarchaeota archaeon]